MYCNEPKTNSSNCRPGPSFGRIAKELGVSRRTLIRWSEEFGIQIENLHQIELERVQERLLGTQAEQLESLIGDYKRYRDALLTRDPSIPHHMLFRAVARLRDQLDRRLTRPPTPVTPDTTPST